MKKATTRLLVELTSTAVASPLILFLLLLAHAWNLAAAIALPVTPLVHPLADWLDKVNPAPQGGWFPTLANGFLAYAILASIWLWVLLMILVKISETMILRKEKQ